MSLEEILRLFEDLSSHIDRKFLTSHGKSEIRFGKAEKMYGRFLAGLSRIDGKCITEEGLKDLIDFFTNNPVRGTRRESDEKRMSEEGLFRHSDEEIMSARGLFVSALINVSGIKRLDIDQVDNMNYFGFRLRTDIEVNIDEFGDRMYKSWHNVRLGENSAFAFMAGGIVNINKMDGLDQFYGMQGGLVLVNSYRGDFCCSKMGGGTVIINDFIGQKSFANLEGGTIVVNEFEGGDAFKIMRAGTVFVNNFVPRSWSSPHAVSFWSMTGGSARIFNNFLSGPVENAALRYYERGNFYIFEHYEGDIDIDFPIKKWDDWKPENQEQWFIDKVMQALHEGYVDSNTIVLFPHLLKEFQYDGSKDAYVLDRCDQEPIVLKLLPSNISESNYSFLSSFYSRNDSKSELIVSGT